MNVRNFDQQTFRRFLRTYAKYHGKRLVYDKTQGNCLMIGKRRISMKSASDIATLMMWRMEKGLYAADPLTSEDYNHIQELHDTGKITTGVITFLLGVSDSGFRKYFKDIKSVELSAIALEAGKKGNRIPQEALVLTWGEVSLTLYEWASLLGLNYNTIVKRYDRHGLCSLVFMTSEEYVAVPKAERDAIVGERKHRVNHYKGGVPEEVPIKNELPTVEISKGQAVSIITALIKDSKDNLLDKSNPYYTSSKMFLRNANGTLAMLLDSIDIIDTQEALQELKLYALDH